VYPPPPIAEEQVKVAMTEHIETLRERLTHEELDAKALIVIWEHTKTAIRTDTLRIIKQRRRTARATYKQTCRQLLRPERRLLEEAAGVKHTVESVTDLLDAMSLQDVAGNTPLQRVRKAITACVRARLALKQRRLFSHGGYRTGKTTKSFYRRLSTKSGDPVVHQLDAAVGHRERGHMASPTRWPTHGRRSFSRRRAPKRLIMKCCNAWASLANIPTYCRTSQSLFQSLEVATEIRAAHPGKACGPDRLGNDWYRDFAGILTPVLTILFNAWYASGVVPPSFLEADIFCLKKGGVAQYPLNFRPLSLMNTDYKRITRILTTRARPKLPMIIHPNQNGLVPMRNIHATIDLFMAAQRVAD
jgi:hypothetical protein